jgi:hypothetical protein
MVLMMDTERTYRWPKTLYNKRLRGILIDLFRVAVWWSGAFERAAVMLDFGLLWGNAAVGFGDMLCLQQRSIQPAI